MLDLILRGSGLRAGVLGSDTELEAVDSKPMVPVDLAGTVVPIRSWVPVLDYDRLAPEDLGDD